MVIVSTRKCPLIDGRTDGSTHYEGTSALPSLAQQPSEQPFLASLSPVGGGRRRRRLGRRIGWRGHGLGGRRGAPSRRPPRLDPSRRPCPPGAPARPARPPPRPARGHPST